MIKLENDCKLIENAKNDPTWNEQLNAELCNGDCDHCEYQIKIPLNIKDMMEEIDKLYLLLKSNYSLNIGEYDDLKKDIINFMKNYPKSKGLESYLKAILGNLSNLSKEMDSIKRGDPLR